jgi:hypothetical protein
MLGTAVPGTRRRRSSIIEISRPNADTQAGAAKGGKTGGDKKTTKK